MNACQTREELARELLALANGVYGSFKLGELYTRMVNGREGAVGDATDCRQMIEEILDDEFPTYRECRVDQESGSTTHWQHSIQSSLASR